MPNVAAAEERDQARQLQDIERERVQTETERRAKDDAQVFDDHIDQDLDEETDKEQSDACKADVKKPSLFSGSEMAVFGGQMANNVVVAQTDSAARSTTSLTSLINAAGARQRQNRIDPSMLSLRRNSIPMTSTAASPWTARVLKSRSEVEKDERFRGLGSQSVQEDSSSDDSCIVEHNYTDGRTPFLK